MNMIQRCVCLGFLPLFILVSACNQVGSTDARPQGAGQSADSPSEVTPSVIPTEAQIWQKDRLLQSYATMLLKQTIPIAADGAMGGNRNNPQQVQVGWQRDGFKAIAYGLSTNRSDMIQRGILAFQWAFERQGADGRFGKSGYPEVVSFLGSYARSIILLKDAGYRPQAQALEKYLPQVKKVLEHPDFQKLEDRWEAGESTQQVTNQVFWAALCYQMIHQVLPNRRLAEKSKAWIKLGLQRQTPVGVFPEKEGSDTNYQNVSLQMLSLYSLYTPESRKFIKPHLVAGFNWLSQKVLADGTWNTSENTRTGKQQERGPSGEFKKGRFGEPEAFIFWSYLGGSAKSRTTAARLISAIKQSLPK